ncbi:MAG: MFS transporter [Acidobacteriota bacterium]|nr:MFS transporter [Acidobacteriota bacterium]
MTRSTRDARRIMSAQAVRAFAYGFGAVLLGVTLDQRGYSSSTVGLVLTAVIAGTVLLSLWLARFGDRVGRRRCYVAMYLALGGVGVVFALPSPIWLLILASLTGTLSTEVVESGPFTSLEQPMLATELTGSARLRGFGRYNAVATLSGSLGSLCAGLPDLVHHWWRGAPSDDRYFLVFVPIALAGAFIASTLSPAVEAPAESRAERRGTPVIRSRPVVVRLSALFALDSFGGGLVVQAFVAYWLTTRFHAALDTVGFVFFASGLLQTVSFLAAVRIGRRFGLLRTMVFTHLPSNVLLASIAFAPNLATAVTLWLVRVTLSQMDVPARQSYVMTLVDPAEQTAAAAYTNTARYLTRPVGPALAGASQSLALGLPFLLAGSIKALYDLTLWAWFRRVPVPDAGEADDAAPGR